MSFQVTLRQALAEVLDVDAQGICAATTFDDLGLDSLLGLRFARVAGDRIGMDIALEWIFDYPTVDALSGFLERHAAEASA